MAEQRLGDRLEALDKEIAGWARLTRNKLRLRLRTLGVQDKAKLAKAVSRIKFTKDKRGKVRAQREPFLLKSLKYALRKNQGDIESIAFIFPRHGIFLEHGVGKGRPVGSGKAGAAKKPWLKPVLENSLDELADLIADNYADIAAEEVKISIPGIIQTTVKVK